MDKVIEVLQMELGLGRGYVIQNFNSLVIEYAQYHFWGEVFSDLFVDTIVTSFILLVAWGSIYIMSNVEYMNSDDVDKFNNKMLKISIPIIVIVPIFGIVSTIIQYNISPYMYGIEHLLKLVN